MLNKAKPATILAAGPHTDAALLAAWDGYIAATHAYDRAHAVSGVSDKDCEPFSRALFAFGDKIEETSALTMAGIAIQLRYLFAALVESPDAAEAAIFGKAHSEALAADLEDARYRMLWRMIENAERAAQPHVKEVSHA